MTQQKLNSKQLKQKILSIYPGWSLKKERRGDKTHVFLISPNGNYIPPINGGNRGAYTDYDKDYQSALENLCKTNCCL